MEKNNLRLTLNSLQEAKSKVSYQTNISLYEKRLRLVAEHFEELRDNWTEQSN